VIKFEIDVSEEDEEKIKRMKKFEALKKKKEQEY
jgi:hypothetical protein